MSVTCDKCKHAEESNTAEGDYFCTRYKIICSGILGCDLGYPKMKTNSDRIRSMTDEELASVITDDWCEIVCGETDYLCNNGTCEQHVLKWLKEEVKHEHT